MVLDRKENKYCDTGRYELVCKKPTLPDFRCVDNKFITEGQKIKRADLQKYSQIDRKQQRLDVQVQKRERERSEKEEEKKRKAKEIVQGIEKRKQSQGESKEGDKHHDETGEHNNEQNKSSHENKDTETSKNECEMPQPLKPLNISDSKMKLNESHEKSKTKKVDKLKDSPYKKSLRDNSKGVYSARPPSVKR